MVVKTGFVNYVINFLKSFIPHDNEFYLHFICISFAILSELKNKYKLKNPSIEKIIGCSTSYFLEYIKSMFVDGMTMDNYGEWHIDHIIPCCMYDFKKKGEIEKSSHYTNLRPLWGTTKIAEKYGHKNYIGNINKSSKII